MKSHLSLSQKRKPACMKAFKVCYGEQEANWKSAYLYTIEH